MNSPNCGASNSVEQARAGDCQYCGAALPHAVRALEQDTEFLRELNRNEAYELPGATYTPWLSSLPPLFLATLPFMYWVLARQTRARKAEAPRLAAQLASMDRANRGDP